MSDKDRSSLKEMYQNLSEEAEGLEKKLKENLFAISEIDKYLNSIYEQEDSDFKVFSPRNVDSIYKEDIEEHKTKKNKLENDNKNMYSRLNRIKTYLEDLKENMDEKPVARNLQVLDIQEKERQRIARDLHDTSLQNLAHLVHKIELASMYADKDVLRAKMELVSINKSLKAIIEEIRNTVFDLRPMHFDDLGVKETFEQLFIRLKATNTSFDFETNISPVVCENQIILMSIFRVVQEACFNAIKHSGGNKISVKIEQKDHDCNIEIKDNGSGFSLEEIETRQEKHFGIPVMRERVNLLGGKIEFHTEPGKGTEIYIEIPLD